MVQGHSGTTGGQRAVAGSTVPVPGGGGRGREPLVAKLRRISRQQRATREAMAVTAAAGAGGSRRLRP